MGCLPRCSRLTKKYESHPTIIGVLTLMIVRNGLTIAGVPPSWSQVALGVLLIAAIAISLNRSKIDVVK